MVSSTRLQFIPRDYRRAENYPNCCELHYKVSRSQIKGEGYLLLNAKAQKSALDQAVVFQDELRLSIHNTTLRQCFTTLFNRGFNESFHRFG